MRWTLDSLRGRRATVMGLGLFGGGLAATRFLVKHGARVLVTDQRDAAALRESVAALSDLPAGAVELRLGRHEERDFAGADLVVANPAVAPSSQYLQIARRAGVPITSEFELFVHLCEAREVVAITGTNGKTTTTTLVADILRRARPRMFLGGNLGRSLLEDLPSIGADDTVVLEVSSYQLESLDVPQGWPRVAIVTNLSPDHMERHRTMEQYALAKQRLVERLDAGGAAVLNRADPWVTTFATATHGNVRWFSHEYHDAHYTVKPSGGAPCLVERDAHGERALCRADAVRLPGAFQLDNALAAAAAARFLGVDSAVIEAALRAFHGVAHRLQRLAPIDGVEIFDNAVSTVPESTITALEAVAAPVRWIAGGKTKGLNLDALIRAARGRAPAVYAYGSAADELAAAAARGGLPARVFAKLDAAFEAAYRDARAGETLLYSPAFPSFDQYRNFTERGAEFLALVERARGAAAADGAAAQA